MRKSSRIGLASVAVVEALGLQALVLAAPSGGAQNPGPTWYSYDVAPGTGFPGDAPYTSHGANAVVVEGAGSINCASTVSTIEFYTDLWIDEDVQTITEITVESPCSDGDITEYKDLILDIYENVETSSSDPARYWGGFMLDEESTATPTYGFPPATLESLNSGTKTLISHATGAPWYFTEDQPNAWSTGVYKEIVTGSYDAPQTYTTAMRVAVNNACATYSSHHLCTEMVTVHTQATTGIEYPWTDYQQVTGMVNGSATFIDGWGTTGWWNAYQNA